MVCPRCWKDCTNSMGLPLTVKQHSHRWLFSSRQFASKTARYLDLEALNEIQNTIFSCILSDWWSYTKACDREHMEAYLKRTHRLSYCVSTSIFSYVCQAANDRLSNYVEHNCNHNFHRITPPERSKRSSTRTRAHNFNLPVEIMLSHIDCIVRTECSENCCD